MTEHDAATSAAVSAMDTSMLLPPTYFTVPTPRASSQDPLWTRTALQEELDRLRLEVDEMRQRQPESGPNVDEDNVSVLSEILTQQTAEIKRQKAEIRRLRSSYEREIADLKTVVESQENQMIEKQESFEKRQRDLVNDYESNLSEKDRQAAELVRQHEADRLSWKSQSREHQLKFDENLLKKDGIIQEMSHSNDELNIQIHKLQSDLSAATERIEKLKVCESWGVERSDVMLQIEDLQQQLQTSSSANDLKQQRLDAMQNILAIQEKELAKYGFAENQEAMTALLTRWREKVFALMVQAESSRISYSRELRDLQSANQDLQRQLEHARSVSATNDLKLMACQAEIQDTKENFQQSSLRLTEARNTLQAVTFERDALKDGMTSLQASVESCVRTAAAHEREMVTKIFTATNSFDRRLTNVSDRFSVLKAQVKRLRAKEAATQIREEYESRFRSLQQEADVVRADRDRLAKQMEKDAEETGTREKNLRDEYETEIRLLASKCDNLLKEVEGKSERLNIVEADLADLQMCSSAIQEDNDELKARLAAVEESRNEAVRITTTELYEEHSQQMAQLQSALDQVRREHATTVITLRQTERDLERVRAEHSNELSTVREEYDVRVSDLQRNINNLEKECNLLKATVRQEGLLRASTIPKLIPSTSPAKTTEEKLDDDAGTHRRAVGDFGPHLANLIEEVRSLVRSVEGSEDFDLSDNDE